jgi:hypothetical protein
LVVFNSKVSSALSSSLEGGSEKMDTSIDILCLFF